jgi:hypothetical protein
MADLRKNSGLKSELVDHILQLFPELRDLTPENKANPPLNEWGSDDWIAFINEYTKGEKNPNINKSTEALRRTLSVSLKQSSRGDGRFGLEAAQIRVRAAEEQQAAAAKAKAAAAKAKAVAEAEAAHEAALAARAKAEITSANKIMMEEAQAAAGVLGQEGVGQSGKAPMPMMQNMATAQNTTKKSSGNVAMSQNAAKKSSGNVPMAQNAAKKSSGNVPMGVPAGVGQAGVGVPPSVGQAGVGAPAGVMQVAQAPMPVMAQAGVGAPAGVGQVPQGPMPVMEQATKNMKAEQGIQMSTGVGTSGASTGGPPIDITPLVTALSTINNTLISSLASIETRAKSTDINPALTKMNSLLSQINSSLPDPTHGGGDNAEEVSNKKAEEVSNKKAAEAKKKAAAAKKKKTGKSKKKAKPKSAGVPGELAKTPMKSAEVPGTIGGVITVLSQINTTLQTSLAAIETRLKLNDVNPALIRMNSFLSEINDSLPEQAGGGTRRSRVKKRTETLRHRRT